MNNKELKKLKKISVEIHNNLQAHKKSKDPYLLSCLVHVCIETDKLISKLEEKYGK